MVNNPPVNPTPAPTVNPPIDDPLLVEYANTLKEQLGDVYDAEFDKLPLKERIANMKLQQKTLEKMGHRSEGKKPKEPEPDTKKNKVLNHLERFEAGILEPPKSSVFNVTFFKEK